MMTTGYKSIDIVLDYVIRRGSCRAGCKKLGLEMGSGHGFGDNLNDLHMMGGGGSPDCTRKCGLEILSSCWLAQSVMTYMEGL